MANAIPSEAEFADRIRHRVAELNALVQQAAAVGIKVDYRMIDYQVISKQPCPQTDILVAEVTKVL